MDADRAERVVARHPRREVHAGQLVTVHGVAADLVFLEPQPHGHRLEQLPGREQLADAGQVVLLQQFQADQARERGVEVGNLLAGEGQLVRRGVLRQDAPLAVVDDAAVGGQRIDAHPVALRQVGIVVVPHDL